MKPLNERIAEREERKAEALKADEANHNADPYAGMTPAQRKKAEAKAAKEAAKAAADADADADGAGNADDDGGDAE